VAFAVGVFSALGVAFGVVVAPALAVRFPVGVYFPHRGRVRGRFVVVVVGTSELVVVVVGILVVLEVNVDREVLLACEACGVLPKSKVKANRVIDSTNVMRKPTKKLMMLLSLRRIVAYQRCFLR
jgi:hypothetical protein